MPPQAQWPQLAYPLVAAALSCTLGCSASAFDDLQDTVGAESSEQPEPLNEGAYSDVFPLGIVVVPGGESAMRFVAGGLKPPSLSRFEYATDGTLTSTSIVIADQLDAELDTPFTIAGASDGLGSVDGLIAVGGVSRVIELYEVGTQAAEPAHRMTLDTTSCPDGPYDLAGAHMVLAQTNAQNSDATGSDPAIDLVASADGNRLLLFPNINVSAGQTPSCFVCTFPELANEVVQTVNGLAAIDFTRVDGQEQELIIAIQVGEPPESMGTRVEIVSVDRLRLDSGANCSFATPHITLTFSSSDAGSGANGIAVGDFDGNDQEGVAFAVPSEDEVIVYADIAQGSGPGAQAYKLELTGDDDGTASFGHAIAAADINDDKDDTDELLVADPRLAVDGVGQAGLVRVFSLRKVGTIPETLESTQLRNLHDSTPETDQRFGQSLAIGEFTTGPDESVDLVIVGATDELFTFFSMEGSADPRGQTTP